MKKFIAIALLLVVIGGVVGVSIAEAATGLPCFDVWKSCKDAGRPELKCDGLWQHCMDVMYP